jgi:hypothetical protein
MPQAASVRETLSELLARADVMANSLRHTSDPEERLRMLVNLQLILAVADEAIEIDRINMGLSKR